MKVSGLYVVVASVLALTFVAGASAGVIGGRFAARGKALHVRATIDDMSGVFDRLDLSADQRARAESIVARTAPRSRAIMLEAAERLRAVADSVDSDLRAILTPEQRVRLDSLRRAPRLMLKRKTVSPEGVTVDTVLDTSFSKQRRR